MNKTSQSKELQQIAVELINFSKHLMVILVAIIAFAAAISLKDSTIVGKIFYVLGLLIGVVSFFFGCDANIKYINAMKKRDSDFNLLPIENRITGNIMDSIQRQVVGQFHSSVVSLILISVALVVSFFSFPKDIYSKKSQELNQNKKVETIVSEDSLITKEKSKSTSKADDNHVIKIDSAFIPKNMNKN